MEEEAPIARRSPSVCFEVWRRERAWGDRGAGRAPFDIFGDASAAARNPTNRWRRKRHAKSQAVPLRDHETRAEEEEEDVS